MSFDAFVWGSSPQQRVICVRPACRRLESLHRATNDVCVHADLLDALWPDGLDVVAELKQHSKVAGDHVGLMEEYEEEDGGASSGWGGGYNSA